MKKMYGYIRVSTTRQGLGASLEAQHDSISKFASSKEMQIIEWFEEKETAAKQGRPIFTKMMKLLKAKKADGVIIHKIDRSTRNLKDWVDITNLLDNGCEVHFAHENFDLNTRSGRLMADILVTVAVDMIRNQKQETIKGQEGRLKQGLFPWRAPIGYLNNGKGKFKSIDPIHGPMVKEAFEMYATQKYALKPLLAHLTNAGLKSVSGGKLSLNGLSTILNNPFYMGIIEIKGISYLGGHEPLISTSLFKSVQDILNGKTNQKVIKHDFKFKKLIRCAHCNYSLIAECQKGTVYYRCHTKTCPTKGIRETYIENKLLRHLSQAELSEEECGDLMNTLNLMEREWLKVQQAILSTNKMQQSKIEDKLERLMDNLLDGTIDKDSFEKRKRILLVEMQTKEEMEKNVLNGKEKILQRTRRFLEFSKNLVKTYQNGILEDQRELLKIFTSNLVTEGKNLLIAMQSPFEELYDRAKMELCDPILDTPRNITGENAVKDPFLNTLESIPGNLKNKRLLMTIISRMEYRQDNFHPP